MERSPDSLNEKLSDRSKALYSMHKNHHLTFAQQHHVLVMLLYSVCTVVSPRSFLKQKLRSRLRPAESDQVVGPGIIATCWLLSYDHLILITVLWVVCPVLRLRRLTDLSNFPTVAQLLSRGATVLHSGLLDAKAHVLPMS